MTEDKCAREITCWDGRTYRFTLNSPWVRRVLSFRGIAGDAPQMCLARFDTGTYTTDHVEHILELGLLGGGMSEREVEALIDAYVRNQPTGPNVLIAQQVLMALFVGEAKTETPDTPETIQ